MSVAFPTLSRNAPRPDSFRESRDQDPTLRSPMESGKVLARARFTVVKKKWLFTYDNLTDADKTLLEVFEDSVGVGSDTITWTHPKTNVGYVVRLAEPIRFSIQPSELTLWEASFTLVED